MWRTAVLCLLVLLAMSVWGQEIPTLGILTGSVKFDTGEPRIDVPVNVTIQAAPQPVTYSLKTNAQGAFSAVVRTGKGTVTAEGITREVTVTDDPEGVRVEIVLEMNGVVVEVVYPDGTPATAAPQCMFWTPNGPQASGGRAIARNKLWHPAVPAKATEFGARVSQELSVTLQRWPLDLQAKRQQFTLTIPKPVRVQVQVQGDNAEPLRQTNVRGSLEATLAGGPDGWDPQAVTTNTRTLNQMTDQEGNINLTLVPGDYALRLRAGDRFGAPGVLKVPGDRETVLLAYSLEAKPRTVTQIVFNEAKKPAAGASVKAIFAVGEKVTLLEAVADAAGKVTWANLPPVKTIVWGDGVPAGVMSGVETAITEPLPPVTPQQNRQYSMKVMLENLPPDATRLTAVYTGTRYSSGERATSTTARGGAISLDSLQQGSRFSAFVMADGTPPRFACLENLYFPFLEEEMYNQPTLSLALRDGALLLCTFTQADGTPVPAVSKLGVVTVKTAQPLPSQARNASLREAGLFVARAAGGGKYRIALPGAGQYRLLVDMYDESAPPLPQLEVAAKEGTNELTIKLPPPLMTVPGGAQVSWLSQHAPASPRNLTVAARVEQMPVFGPRDGLLCAWYRPAPNLLAVLRMEANGVKRDEYALRTVVVRGETADGEMSFYSWWLHALFPNKTPMSMPASDRPNQTEIADVAGSSSGVEMNLWNLPYLISTSGTPPYVKTDVPAEGATDLAVKLPAAGRPTMRQPATTVPVRFIFPPYDYTKAREGGAYSVIIPQFDVPTSPESEARIYPNNWSNDRSITIRVPAKATKVSFCWPGVGAIREAALPNLADVQPNTPPTMTLTDWTDGITLAGTIQRANGAAWAKKRFLVTVRQSDAYRGRGEMYLNTDDAGKFLIKGLVPGPVSIYPRPTDESYDEQCGWAFNVPEAGMKDAVLCFNDAPFRVSISSRGQSMQTAWWVPERGAPQPLPMMYGQIRTYSPPAAAGTLWAYAPDGSGVLEQVSRPEGATLSLTSDGMGASAFTSPLGLSLPLETTQPLPTRVTLIGQGPLAGLTADYTSLRWFPSVLLNRIVTQIDAVPPGTWLVQMERDGAATERVVEIGPRGAALALEP